MSTVTTVTLTRRRHPFEGRSLRVLGSMRRHGTAELLVVLPDGSKRLIPAAWTDLGQPAAAGGDAAATLGSVPDLLGQFPAPQVEAAMALLAVLIARVAAAGGAAGAEAGGE